MSRARFSVSFDIVTPESAEHGDAAERGFICEGATLRNALADVQATRDACSSVECIECDSAPCDRPRWVTVSNGPSYRTGESESRALHIPATVSRSSARRIARLVGATL